MDSPCISPPSVRLGAGPIHDYLSPNIQRTEVDRWSMAREIQTVFNKIHITTPQFLNARWQRFLARFTQQALNHDWVLAAWGALTTAVIFHLGTDVVIIWVSLAIAQRSLLWMLRVFFNSFPFDRLVGLKSCHGGLQEKRGNSFFFVEGLLFIQPLSLTVAVKLDP